MASRIQSPPSVTKLTLTISQAGYAGVRGSQMLGNPQVPQLFYKLTLDDGLGRPGDRVLH